jgi:hypothetical protein
VSVCITGRTAIGSRFHIFSKITPTWTISGKTFTYVEKYSGDPNLEEEEEVENFLEETPLLNNS